MNSNQRLAQDLKIGDVILVSYVSPNDKDFTRRGDVKLDENGFPTEVSFVRDRALVGRGMMLQVSKGVFRRIMPDEIATLA